MPTYDGTGSMPSEALELGAGEGACPPVIVEYRIYPQMIFAEAFGVPPATVQT